MTLVEISLFKPTGFSDRWRVETADRGRAVRSVMAKYDADTLRFVNYINATTRGSEHCRGYPKAELVD